MQVSIFDPVSTLTHIYLSMYILIAMYVLTLSINILQS